MKRFLLADDDEDDVDIFRDALNEIDNSIILYDAEDGEKAMEKLKNGECDNPNIIFLLAAVRASRIAASTQNRA